MEGVVIKRFYIGSTTKNGQPCFYGIYNLQTTTHDKPVRFLCNTHSFVERGDYLKALHVTTGQSQYGSHYEADRISCVQTLLPQNPPEIEQRLKNVCKNIAGLGPKRIKQLAAVGPAVWEGLRDNIALKAEAIAGISPSILAQVKKALGEYMEKKTRLPAEDDLAELQHFLDGIGIQWPDSVLLNMLPLCETENADGMDRSRIASLIHTIKTDPIKLLDVCNIGIQRMKQLVEALDLEDGARHGIEVVLQLHTMCSQGGHTCIEASAVKDACSAAIQNDFEAIVGELVARGTIVKDGTRLFLKSLWKCENGIRSCLAIMRDKPSMNRIYEGERMEEAVDAALEAPECILSENQKQGVRMVFNNPVSIICGGAGTGKTTVVRTVLDILIRVVGMRVEPYLHVNLVAPTGKAVTRLMQTTGDVCKLLLDRVNIMTVHKLIAQEKAAKEVGKKNGPEAAEKKPPASTHTLYVLDEASMVDVEIYHYFLELIKGKGNATLVILGDTHQLPSVGPGDVLRDMLAAAGVPSIELNVIHRQEKLGALTHSLTQLRKMRQEPHLTIPPEWNDKTLTRVPIYTWEDIKEYIKERAAKRKSKFEDMLFITPINANVDELQPIIRDTINPSTAQNTPFPKLAFRLFDRVMQTKNNYEKHVFNGMIGKVVDIKEHVQKKEYNDGSGKHTVPETTYTLSVEMEDIKGEMVTYTLDEAMSELRHAYVSTVHKAQGSEAKEVVLILGRCGRFSLHRNMLYTALSRAKQRAVVVGPPESIPAASRNVMPPRQTGGFT